MEIDSGFKKKTLHAHTFFGLFKGRRRTGASGKKEGNCAYTGSKYRSTLYVLRTNAPTGRVDRNWTKSGGKASWPGFLLVGELAQVPHYIRRRGRLRVAISTVSDPSGSGRVDMLTSPVAAARAVATGAWAKSKHIYLIRASVETTAEQ